MDSSGKGRRTPVHSRSCAAVGKSGFTSCSTEPGECELRYAHDLLQTNYVSKLPAVYERDLGMTNVWNETSRIGNLFKSDLVSKYMAFTRGEQKKAGVLVKQAPVLLQNHMSTIISHLKSNCKPLATNQRESH